MNTGRQQFQSCSNDEIKACIKARIETIREYNKFTNSNVLQKFYPNVFMCIRLSRIRNKAELKFLFKHRHRSGQEIYYKEIKV
jgi:hypothetical protein